MKWLIRIVLIVVVLVVVLAVGGILMIDSIATAAVKHGAEFATQTDVELEGIDVKLFSTEGEIKKLDIKNPNGPFRDKFDSFMILGTGTAQISAGSLMSDTIVIPKVELSNIELSLVGLEGKKNYEVILESLKRFQGDNPPKESEGGKKIVIKELIIRNITVNYYFDADPALGAIAMGPKQIVIADDEPMVLTNVGAGGVPMPQITADIITDIMVQVMANLAGDLGGHMKGLANSLVDTLGTDKLGETLKDLNLGDHVKAIGDLGVDLGEGVGDLLKGVGEGTGDVLKGVGGGLKNLLGGKEEEKKEEE